MENQDLELNEDINPVTAPIKKSKLDTSSKKLSFTLDPEATERLDTLLVTLNERSKRRWTLQDVANEVLQAALKSDLVAEVIEAQTSMEWRVEDALNDPSRRDAVLKALGMTADKTGSKKSRRARDTGEKESSERDAMDDDTAISV